VLGEVYMATLLDRGSTPLISTNITAKARRYVNTEQMQ